MFGRKTNQIIALLQEVLTKMAESQKDFDTLLGGLTAEIQALAAALDAAFADLLAKITAGAPPADLTAEAAAVQSAIDQIKGFEAKAKAADPGPQTPTA